MIQFDKWMLPAGEQHLQEWMLKVNRRVDGRLTYQYHKYEALLERCPRRRVCIDAGAHVGLLSFWFARDFERVEAFEPVSAHRECFKQNVLSSNVTLHSCALGEKAGRVAIRTAPSSSGDSWVDGPGDIQMRRLDDFGFENVDCIKVDTEGHEEFIIKGAVETIKKSRPVMLVEQKGHEAVHFGLKKEGAIKFLEGLGMKALRPPMSGDWIMGW